MLDVFTKDICAKSPDALEGIQVTGGIMGEGEQADGIRQVFLHMLRENHALLAGMHHFCIHHRSGNQSVAC